MLTLALPAWLFAATFGGLTPAQWCVAALIAAVGYPSLDGLRRCAIRKLSAPPTTDAVPSASTATTATTVPEQAASTARTAHAAAPAMPYATGKVVAIGLLHHTPKPMMIATALLLGLTLAIAVTPMTMRMPFGHITALTTPASPTDGMLAWLQRGWQTLILLQCALWASHAVGLLSHRYLAHHRAAREQAAARLSSASLSEPDGARPVPPAQTTWGMQAEEEGINPVIVRVLVWSARALMWALFLLSLMAQAGVNITAFVASLSIGAVAIGFAVQGILSDLFASLAIGLDKPFRIGDFVTFGDVSGTIEQVGMKTTRIRSLRGEEVICSNTALLQQQIHNFQRMETRRIVFRFGLAYATSAERLRAVPPMVEDAFAGIPNARFDRVHFAALAERALEFEVVYYVTRPEYDVYMDCQQALNLAIVAGLAARDIAFAQPIREIRLAH
jgi:small-conductance mechanosensitive channel